MLQGSDLTGSTLLNRRGPIRMTLLGAMVGWVNGMSCFMGLVLYLPPTIKVSHDHRGWCEEEVTITDRLCQAPFSGDRNQE